MLRQSSPPSAAAELRQEGFLSPCTPDIQVRPQGAKGEGRLGSLQVSQRNETDPPVLKQSSPPSAAAELRQEGPFVPCAVTATGQAVESYELEGLVAHGLGEGEAVGVAGAGSALGGGVAQHEHVYQLIVGRNVETGTHGLGVVGTNPTAAEA